MIIGAADKRLEPGSVSFWSNAVFEGQSLERFRSKRGQECGRQVIDRFCPGAILYFERVAKKHRFFDVLERQGTLSSVRPVLRAHQRRRHEIDEPFPRRVSSL